jgi:hypothetical protein
MKRWGELVIPPGDSFPSEKKEGAQVTPNDGDGVCFEEMFKELSAQEKYRSLLSFPLEKLHNGYFAQDKKGGFKDTSGDTQADDDVYNLIMRDKEQLLSLDEPLRFIFSHSALREGWDNPNVFQICTLNETRSVVKKRQEMPRLALNACRAFNGVSLTIAQSFPQLFCA